MSRRDRHRIAMRPRQSLCGTLASGRDDHSQHRNSPEIGLMLRPMSIWGKFGGAAAGFLLGGGPLGAVAGAVAGHFLFDREAEQAGQPDEEPGVAFTIAIIALGAKMAKADGVVTDDEVETFFRIFRVPPGEKANVE